MYALYLVSVWLHILAATAWIGGMFFLVLVVVPWLKKGHREAGGAFLRETGEGFRAVGWACFAILLVTGTFNLWTRGVRLSSFVDSAWIESAFGKAVLTKLTLFLGVLIISAIHDFSVGPRASRAMESAPTSQEAERLRKQASMMGRVNALFALGLVGAAVVIVRGWPF
jgi:uncharacterized membrane protein